MNNESLKLELIHWILLMKDIQVLNNIKSMKNFYSEKTVAVQPRQFGCGQGIFTYMADDFDATPPGFEEYMLP
ncbi:hypothetical protein [Phormidium nigroviride]